MVCVSRDSFFAPWLPICAEEPHRSSPSVVQANALPPTAVALAIAGRALELGTRTVAPWIVQGRNCLGTLRSFAAQQQATVQRLRDLVPVLAWMWNSRKGPPPPSSSIRDPFVDQYVHGDENPRYGDEVPGDDEDERSMSDRLGAGLRHAFSFHLPSSNTHALAAQRATQTSSVAIMAIICIAALLVVV